ncbi:MAG: acyl-CoA dehydrogenase family protein [Frankiaceae bacterium]
MRCTATPTEDGSAYILNGSKLWITNGPIASLFVVMAVVPRSPGHKGGIHRRPGARRQPRRGRGPRPQGGAGHAQCGRLALPASCPRAAPANRSGRWA